MNQKMIDQLKRHEGLRLKPYKCTADKLTIGYGRNLEDNGISEFEAEELLKNDVIVAQVRLEEEGWYNQLDECRKAVIENMYFNIGNRLFGFKKMIGALSDDDYETASKEMVTGSNGGESKWASQVGKRAYELADQMRTGEWQNG